MLSSDFRRRHGSKQDLKLARDEVPTSLREGLSRLIERLSDLWVNVPRDSTGKRTRVDELADDLDRFTGASSPVFTSRGLVSAYRETCRKLRRRDKSKLSWKPEETVRALGELTQAAAWDEFYELCEILTRATRLYDAIDGMGFTGATLGELYPKLMEFSDDPETDKKTALGVKRMIAELDTFVGELNALLDEEGAMWRMRHGEIVPVLPDEVDAVIDDADSAASALSGGGTRIHLQKARRFLALRPDPELQNAVKEAACAVEAAVKDRSGTDKFERGLRLMKQHDLLQDTWRRTIDELFGEASTAHQVRHGSPIPSNMTYEEAKDLVSLAAVLVQHLSGLQPVRHT